MRKIIVSNIMSLDGFYSAPDGNPAVLNMDTVFDDYNLERMLAADTMLIGRGTFELFDGYWPLIEDAPEDPANPALDATNRAISRRYQELRKVVVSDTLVVDASQPWNRTTEVVGRSAVGEWLAAEDGEIVVFGSHILWNSLVADGLVDELHLMIGPAAIGAGVPIFTGPAAFDLADVREFEGSGNVLHRFLTR